MIVAVGAVYLWALLSTGRSTLARALVWMEAGVGDQQRFPARAIPAGDRSSPLPVLPAQELSGRSTRRCAAPIRARSWWSIAIASSSSGAVPRTRETSWSVAKPFVSTLVGIAIDQGRIGSADEALTDYVPELARRDPCFRADHARRSAVDALRVGPRGVRRPVTWGDDTYTYDGIDLRKEALERTGSSSRPASAGITTTTTAAAGPRARARHRPLVRAIADQFAHPAAPSRG